MTADHHHGPDSGRAPGRGASARTTPRDIACRELVELLTEYLDDVLPPDEKAAVDAHLDGCEACRTYLDQVRATIATLGSVSVETLSDAACDTVIAAFAERSWNRHDDRP